MDKSTRSCIEYRWESLQYISCPLTGCVLHFYKVLAAGKEWGTMKYLKQLLQYCKKRRKSVRLADAFLMIILAILLLQSVVILFASPETNDVHSQIDVMLRTTMTSIFGYFVSTKAFPDSRHFPLPPTPQHKNPRKNLQTFIIGSLCVFSILVMVLLRFFVPPAENALEYIALYHDFISGGIGFLIGMPKRCSP